MTGLIRKRSFHVAVIAVLVIAPYANSLFNGFNIDDPNMLLDNTAVHGLSIENVRDVFTSAPNSVEYLPVRDLTYMLDYELWGLKPFGYHLSNMLYYLAACLSLYLFLSRLFGGGGGWSGDGVQVAFLATALFAVHPVHVESVAGIAQRKDLVSGALFFLSLWAFVSYKDGGRARLYALSLGLFALSFLSKATAAALPLVVLLINHIYFENGAKGRTRRAAETSAFFALAAALAALNITVAWSGGVLSLSAGGFIQRIPTALTAVFYYLFLLIVPWPLTVWHEFEAPGGLASGAPGGGLGIAAILSFVGLLTLLKASSLFKKKKALSFSILFYLVSIVPVVGLLGTSTVVAERYLFLPSAGFASVAAWLVIWGAASRPALGRQLAALSVIVLVIFSALTANRNLDWKNSGTLIEAGLRANPDSYRLTKMLGRYHFVNRRYEIAMGLFRKADELDKGDTDLKFYGALLLYERGDYAGALGALEKSGLLALDVIDVHYLKGRIHLAAGDEPAARRSFTDALGARKMKGVFFKRDAREALAALERKE